MTVTIKKQEYPLAPEGGYDVEIYKVEEKTNRYDGRPQAQMIFKVISEDNPYCLVDWFNLTLHPKAKIFNLFDALKLTIPDKTEELNLEEYIGRKLHVKVKHREKGGRTYANITEYLPEVPDFVFE